MSSLFKTLKLNVSFGGRWKAGKVVGDPVLSGWAALTCLNRPQFRGIIQAMT